MVKQSKVVERRWIWEVFPSEGHSNGWAPCWTSVVDSWDRACSRGRRRRRSEVGVLHRRPREGDYDGRNLAVRSLHAYVDGSGARRDGSAELMGANDGHAQYARIKQRLIEGIGDALVQDALIVHDLKIRQLIRLTVARARADPVGRIRQGPLRVQD